MIALVTGSASGFGRATVSALLSDGWTVFASMRKKDARGTLFSDELARHPGRLVLLELDVTVPADRSNIARRIEAECGGRLDLLVNNAGYGLFGALEDLSEGQLREQMEVNFFGLALLTKELLPSLRQARGRIVNLSSSLGFVGFPLTSAYCASKFAVSGLGEALRYELEPHGVQVATLEPGGHRTSFATNVRWGEKSFDPASPYALASRGYARMKDELSSRENPATPDSVAEEVLRLARTKRMPARVVCGKDAKAMHFLRRTRLRARLAETLLGLLYRKRFLREAA